MDVIPTPIPKRRGRPPKAKPSPAPDLAAELVELIKQLTAQQALVMGQALEAQKAHAEALKMWMTLFAPAQTPTPSTSPDDRAAMTQAREEAEWDPVLPTYIQSMLTSIDQQLPL